MVPGMDSNPPSDFTRIHRVPDRGRYDQATIHAILDAAPNCHIGHIIDGRPVVTPTLHWREGDAVYWHGSAASRMLRANEAGGEVCLTVTLVDGFVLARSGFHHSLNYRSVMCFGTPRLVSDPAEKLAALQGFVDRLFPGRWDTLRPPTEPELKATWVLTMKLDEASAKLRTGPPVDDDEDRTWPVWAGVLPLHLAAGAPQPDAYVTAGLLPPARTPAAS
jgi:nitroimidazol reductase NimA-like FMN-containing flavoprotein (pyridoxamine 5'-phosphate oxidase superfamily)